MTATYSARLGTNPAVIRCRAFYTPVTYAELTPPQRIKVLRKLLDLSEEQSLREWATAGRSALRWQAARGRLLSYAVGMAGA